MKRSNFTIAIVGILVVVLAGFYAFDSHSKEASLFSIPSFKSTTNIPASNKQPVASLQDLNNAFVNIAKETNPTVVTIKIKQTVKVQQSPFFRFFGQGQQGPQKRERRGLGSGVIVSQDGYILTNNHVVHDADDITVKLGNDKTYKGKVVGTDPLTDLAVVKIDADNLPAIKIGNSDQLKVGELVMAIGSPERLSHTVTQGIVSAKNRHINIISEGHGRNKRPGYENYIQTDASINPGNSGGALINMDGELVGINAAISSQSGGSNGLGFAVPINLAKSVMKSIIKNGKVTHAELGIWGKDLKKAYVEALGLKNNKGVLVNSVNDGSPADKAGLQQGDIIKTLNGKPVGSYATFRTDIATSKPGQKITLGILRDGKSKKIHVKLGKLQMNENHPSSNQDHDIQKNLGFRVDKITPRIADQLDLDPNQQGVVVTDIKRGSKAQQEGLQKGDIITKANKKSIQNISDFKNVIESLANKDNPVLLLQIINRQGVNEYIAFKL